MGLLHSATVAVTDVCVVVFLVAWVMGAVYFGVKGRRGLVGWVRALPRTLPGRVPVLVGVGVFSAVVGCAPASFWRHLQYWQPELAVLGALLAVASTALLLWARWALGAMWASVPLVQERHELRTDGPYGLVRHPIYTGLLGLVVGGTLACGFGVWVAYLVVAVPWLLRRVRVEDDLMAGEFGASYVAYGARVPALIPWTHPARAARPRRAGGERR
ncbi:methyltransferase family protein [Streptomyces angustmyceticus]|uniref:methyltransferase family protein n=1 Tax=Streptomyces angustmyceticus TaxID=285578 RepID=UPI003D93B3E7